MIDRAKPKLQALLVRNFDLWNWTDQQRISYLTEQRAQLKIQIDAQGPKSKRRIELETMQRTLTTEQLRLETGLNDGPMGGAA